MDTLNVVDTEDTVRSVVTSKKTICDGVKLFYNLASDIVYSIEKFQDKNYQISDFDTSLRMQKLIVDLLQKIKDYKLARDTSGEFSQVVQKNNEIRLGSDIEESFSELILEIMLLAKKTKEDIDVGEALRKNLMDR